MAWMKNPSTTEAARATSFVAAGWMEALPYHHSVAMNAALAALLPHTNTTKPKARTARTKSANRRGVVGAGAAARGSAGAGGAWGGAAAESTPPWEHGPQAPEGSTPEWIARRTRCGGAEKRSGEQGGMGW